MLIKQDRQCTYTYNIQARSLNHCCRVRAVSITYSECVSVALGISMQSARKAFYCHLWPVWLSIFFHIVS